MPECMLHTERLEFRLLAESDSECLFRTVGDPDVMAHWWPGEDPDIEATLRRIAWINKHWTKHGFGDWGMWEKEKSRLIGFCGLHYISNMPEVNIGYAFEKSRWRLGYGYEATTAILSFGFNQIGLNEIVAVIVPENLPSRRLAEKAGMLFWKSFLWEGRDRVAYIARKEEYVNDQEEASTGKCIEKNLESNYDP